MLLKPLALIAAGVVAWPVGHAHAIEVYGGAGLPGITVGVAESINADLTMRADLSALSTISVDRVESGIRYEGESTIRRLGVFADWYALGNGFRLTGGLTFNQMRFDLQGRPDGDTIMIGDTVYAVGADDRFTARIEYPRVTPYVGIGWGHHNVGRGWGFHADLGVSIGRASVSASVTGNLATQPGIQDDVDRELAELRDYVDRLRVIPQISLGVSYRF